MREKLIAVRHRTLGALRDAGLHLHAYCNNPGCHWSSRLDLSAMIERLGEDQSALPPDLAPRLVCSRCGGKNVAVVLSAAEELPDDAAEYLRRQSKKRD
ncbi:hypothetical protein [Rhizobium sp. TRM95796]|uniref:hypothetical protein n=1 Tax=Rhizobium sp. TRM95796 TaxID=2979862 RepID=UPI0021E737EC|nr:hypothetical protein [Rhizobium sp. TRM95796]MCV3768557.1 hypothetical protein [Rhizobium sp. TRM95796]